MKPINGHAMYLLRTHKKRLTFQQYNTLKGQILAGDGEGAIKGLYRILGWKS